MKECEKNWNKIINKKKLYLVHNLCSCTTLFFVATNKKQVKIHSALFCPLFKYNILKKFSIYFLNYYVGLSLDVCNKQNS